MILWTVVLEKPLESPLDSKEVQPVHPKGNQSWIFWIFIGRTDVEAETPILWPPDAKNWLIWKDPDAGKYWRWEEKGTTEDEMVGWLTDAMDISLSKPWDLLMDRECCSPWGRKELDMTEWLNLTESCHLKQKVKPCVQQQLQACHEEEEEAGHNFSQVSNSIISSKWKF